MKDSKTKMQIANSDPSIKAVQQRKINEDTEERKLYTKHRYLLNSLLENLPEHIYFKDTECRFIRISVSLARAFGLNDPSEAIGKTDFDFFSKEHAKKAFDDENEIMRTGKSISVEEKETWPDQNDTWVLTSKMPLYGENGKIIGTFGISGDITDRKIVEEKLRSQSKSLENQIQKINLLHDQLSDQACRDTLTGLSNRRLMDVILSQQLLLCKRLQQSFSIVIIDIDHFKNINDRFGHQSGDTLLKEFGKCILASTRTEDFSGRFGGDEFLMAFQKMSDQQTLTKAETLRKKLEAIFLMRENHRLSATVSIGIAAFPVHGNNVEELIRKADAALYMAKEKGRNQVISASELISVNGKE